MIKDKTKKFFNGKAAKIMGAKYKLLTDDTLLNEHDLLGLSIHYRPSKIVIDSTLQSSDFVSTFLHEVLEVINRRSETKIEHDKITQLENGLYNFIANNPKLMYTLLEEIYSKEHKR